MSSRCPENCLNALPAALSQNVPTSYIAALSLSLSFTLEPLVVLYEAGSFSLGVEFLNEQAVCALRSPTCRSYASIALLHPHNSCCSFSSAPHTNSQMQILSHRIAFATLKMFCSLYILLFTSVFFISTYFLLVVGDFVCVRRSLCALSLFFNIRSLALSQF